ncbi:hypothetical protein [Paraliobacillus salinarum]|uniref:hypothetical protein n=1 Tax=Paraliobacillus salinarum TaxID=1158996 RepID=UPI0015F60977|nr:hypothetical protein [Paraliobacillus salinarum]
MKFKSNGFDDLNKELKKMQKAASEMEKGEEVPFGKLFNKSFMEENTQFSSFDDLLQSGGFEITSEEDFDAIPESELDEHVAKTTNFENWQDMLGSATQEYAVKRLGF